MRRRQRGRGVLASGLPADVFCGARVTWVARRSALVEGQRGVVELTQERIRLRTDEGIMTICGEAMMLRELSVDAALIDASHIHTITYLNAKDHP